MILVKLFLFHWWILRRRRKEIVWLLLCMNVELLEIGSKDLDKVLEYLLFCLRLLKFECIYSMAQELNKCINDDDDDDDAVALAFGWH